MSNTIIVICGLQGSGKDTIANIYHKFGYNKVKLYTTRQKRDVNDNNYHFVTVEQFKQQEYLIENVYNNYEGNSIKQLYYGLKDTEIKENDRYVIVVELEDVQRLINKYGNRVLPIVVYTDNETRLKRAKQRGNFDIRSFDKRELEDVENFNNVPKFINSSYVTIHNTDVTTLTDLEQDCIVNLKIREFKKIIAGDDSEVF